MDTNANTFSDLGVTDNIIPLPNVSSPVLIKVLEYCEHHKADPLPTVDSGNDVDDSRRKTAEISDWDAKFIQVSLNSFGKLWIGADCVFLGRSGDAV